jgi:hypothetical protein
VQGAGWKEYGSSVQILTTCGETMAEHEIPHICGFIIMAWNEAAELIAADSMCDIIIFHSVAACIQHVQLVQKDENVQTPLRKWAESWYDWLSQRRDGGVGESVKPHAAGPCRDAVHERLGSVGWARRVTGHR